MALRGRKSLKLRVPQRVTDLATSPLCIPGIECRSHAAPNPSREIKRSRPGRPALTNSAPFPSTAALGLDERMSDQTHARTLLQINQSISQSIQRYKHSTESEWLT